MVNPNFCKSEGNVQRLAFKTFLVSLFQASKNQRSLSYPVRQPPLSLPDPLSCASECIKMEKQQAGSCNALIFDRFCNSIFHINLYWWEKIPDRLDFAIWEGQVLPATRVNLQSMSFLSKPLLHSLVPVRIQL